MIVDNETEWVRKMAILEDEFGSFPSVGRSPKQKVAKQWNGGSVNELPTRLNFQDEIDKFQILKALSKESVDENDLVSNRKRCNEKPCLIEKFFKDQEKLPFHMRSSSCLICCTGSKCRTWCL